MNLPNVVGQAVHRVSAGMGIAYQSSCVPLSNSHQGTRSIGSSGLFSKVLGPLLLLSSLTGPQHRILFLVLHYAFPACRALLCHSTWDNAMANFFLRQPILPDARHPNVHPKAQRLCVLAGGYQGAAVSNGPRHPVPIPFLPRDLTHYAGRLRLSFSLSIPIPIIHCTPLLSSQTRVTYWSPSPLRFAWQGLSDDGKMTVKVSHGISQGSLPEMLENLKKNFFFNTLFSLNYI